MDDGEMSELRSFWPLTGHCFDGGVKVGALRERGMVSVWVRRVYGARSKRRRYKKRREEKE